MAVIEEIAFEKARLLNGYNCMSKENRKRFRGIIRRIYEEHISWILTTEGYHYHHTAIHPRGIRKRNPVSAEVHPYEGRFGIGYTVHRYKGGSDNSHYVDYWIKEE